MSHGASSSAGEQVPFSMPPLKAYDRSAIAAASLTSANSSLPRNLGNGTGSPIMKGGAVMRRQQRWLAMARLRGLLLLLVLITAIASLVYSDKIGQLLSLDQTRQSPIFKSLVRVESKQSELLNSMTEKIDEINERTSRAMLSLSSIMERSTEQQSVIQQLEAQLKTMANASEASKEQADKESDDDVAAREMLKSTQEKLEKTTLALADEIRRLRNQSRELKLGILTEVGELSRKLVGGEIGVVMGGGGREGESGGSGSSSSGIGGGQGGNETTTLVELVKATAEKVEKISEMGKVMAEAAAAGGRGEGEGKSVGESVERVGGVQREMSERVQAKLEEAVEKVEELRRRVMERVDDHQRVLSERGEGLERKVEALRQQVAAAGGVGAARGGVAELEREKGQLENQVQLQKGVISDLRAQLATLEAKQGQAATAAAAAADDEVSVGGISSAALEGWKQNLFETHGSYGFVKFSAYRASRSSFVAVGLGLLAIRDVRLANVCMWITPLSRHRGSLRVLFPMEHHSLRYEALVIFCNFDIPIKSGGHLVAFIDREAVLLYRELPGKYPDTALDPQEPFPSPLAVCTAPLHGRAIETRVVVEFLESYKLHGANKFVFYEAESVSGSLKSYFEKWIAAGEAEVVDFRGIRKFETWYFGQLVALHDCIFRLRYSARWVLSADFDEYIWVRVPDTPLLTFLDRYSGRRGVSHGSFWYSVYLCRSRDEHLQEMAEDDEDLRRLRAAPFLPEKEFLVENFIFRWPFPACHHNGENGVTFDPKKCPLDRGHRKYFVNPRLIERVGIHGPVVGDEDFANFEETSTDDIVHAHYHGLLGTGLVAHMCNTTKYRSEQVGWWELDLGFPKYLRKLRARHTCNFTGDGCARLPSSPLVLQ